MLRELNENEMMMVSGGGEEKPKDEIIVTGTKVTQSYETKQDIQDYYGGMVGFPGPAGPVGGGSTPVEGTPVEEYDPCAELDRLEEQLLGLIDLINSTPTPSGSTPITIAALTLQVFGAVGHGAADIQRIANGCNG